MKILFEFDEQKCSACGACAIACMDQNNIDVEAGQQPHRKVFRGDSADGSYYLSIACLHCTDAPCVTACPVGCIRKDGETGLTLFNTTNCIGCHSCAMACPYGAPSFRTVEGTCNREKMEKCNGCYLRIAAGLAPACVHACPTDALTWRWAEDDETSSIAKLYQSWQAIK